MLASVSMAGTPASAARRAVMRCGIERGYQVRRVVFFAPAFFAFRVPAAAAFFAVVVARDAFAARVVFRAAGADTNCRQAGLKAGLYAGCSGAT